MKDPLQRIVGLSLTKGETEYQPGYFRLVIEVLIMQLELANSSFKSNLTPIICMKD